MTFDEKIFDKFKKSPKGVTPITPSSKFREYNKNDILFYKMREFILSKREHIKIFLVLALKQVTWRKELENTFDTNPKIISDFFEYSKENGLILYKRIFELDDLYYESIIMSNTKSFYAQIENIKVYVLSPLGIELFEQLHEEILKISEDRHDLQQIIDDITKKTETFRLYLAKIMDLETNPKYDNIECNAGWRIVEYPDGTIIQKKTKRAKEMDKAIEEYKQEMIEYRKNNGLIENGK